MKTYALPALLLSLLAVSCQQAPPPYYAGGNPIVLSQSNIPRPVVGVVLANPYAAPSQSYIDPSNPDAAFDQQAQAYADQQAAAQYQPQSPAYANPTPSQSNEIAAVDQNFMAQPSRDQNNGVMDYKVTITNGTPNRLFIEAQDASGAIYPCGHMQKGQSMSTRMTQEPAIKGPILLVVRDPDQPGAPELRRYRITPPTASYSNKTVHLTVIPKGRYSVAIDDQLCFISESDD